MTRFRKPLRLFLSLAFVCGVAARPILAQSSGSVSNSGDATATILVDDDKVQCPTAAFTSIQAAVNAAKPGDHIRVCAGNYPEQITINKPLHIRGDNGAVVIPSDVTTTTTSTSGVALAVIIFVTNADGVSIRNLTVDGSQNGLAGCGPALVGIYYQNSSGTIAHDVVRHVRLAPTLPGCQSGDAILVDTTGSGTSRVEIRDNSVWDYQKNGITANEGGTDATIDSNAVTGIGPTPGAAQNGIQIGFGAGGSITNNTIADNVWATCTPESCTTNATGVLVFESNGIDVENNTTASNNIGIFVGGDHGIVRGNTVFNSEVLFGVALMGNDDRADANKITHSDQAGVFVQGNGNRIDNNEITDAAIGILKVAGSTGTQESGNTFFDTPIPVQDPAPGHAMGVQPVH